MHEPQQTHIMTSDGQELRATLFEPQTPNGCVVLISSAMGVHRRYYARYAEYLAGRGFVALTYDYRGIGDSRPASLRGYEAYLWEWGAKDQAACIDWLREHYSSAQLGMVGHSVGGQIIGLAQNNAELKAVLGVATQNGYWQLWPGLLKVWIFSMWHAVIPTVAHLFGYLPGKLMGAGEDVPKGVVLEWAQGGRQPRYILDTFGNTDKDFYDQFTAPLLVYSFSDDNFAPMRTVEALLAFYPNANTTHRHIHPAEVGVKAIGHFGFFRTQFENTLWKDSADWLTQRLAEA